MFAGFDDDGTICSTFQLNEGKHADGSDAVDGGSIVGGPVICVLRVSDEIKKRLNVNGGNVVLWSSVT